MKAKCAIVTALVLSNIATAASLGSSSKLFESAIIRESINQATGNVKDATDDALALSNAMAFAAVSSSSEMLGKYINQEYLNQVIEEAQSSLHFLCMIALCSLPSRGLRP